MVLSNWGETLLDGAEFSRVSNSLIQLIAQQDQQRAGSICNTVLQSCLASHWNLSYAIEVVLSQEHVLPLQSVISSEFSLPRVFLLLELVLPSDSVIPIYLVLSYESFHSLEFVLFPRVFL